jgi:maltose alpha-D-glucosyltransferase / alpha-amylase
MRRNFTMNSKNIDTFDDPLWYKDAIIYQVHVRSFFDNTGDGIGDFRGLMQKLDYIQNLGVNTLWLLPFYPSPLKDGGYDIADFTNIHPSYGTLGDFRRFVKEAHSRGLRIITELVLNHTSTEHRWFQRSRSAKPGSPYRDYYVWSDTPEKYQDARIIFQDFEVSNWTYDHVAKAYYWHRFYSHQPDLNFENPKVQKEILRILDFWFQAGVDGFRLDAVPYLFEAEGTNCENLPQTHEYLKQLRKYVDDNYHDRLLLAEANQWPNDAADYFGDGDECHMAFHFPLMPRLYMALRMEDRFPIVDIMEQTPTIPYNCQWAIFLRNHDELTLEMVSDEERDYMYKAFARDPQKRVNVGIRRRLFPLLGGDLRSIELLNFLLFSMPGTPIVYYGDEIGMGDNYYLGDRDGVRTPMQWSPDKNAGFSNTDPQRLFLPVIIDHNYHYTTVNVENYERNPSSFLWWKRRVIAKRKQYQAFGRGTIKFINTNNPKVLAFVREYQQETILVVVNLSRYSQFVELDLAEYSGSTPMEVFSRNDFSLITEEPWTFSMQYKNYFWFELQKPGAGTQVEPRSEDTLSITVKQWESMNVSLQSKIKDQLYQYILRTRWFRGDTRKLREISIVDVIPLGEKKIASYLFLIMFDFIEGSQDIYLMPVSLAIDARLNEINTRSPESVIACINYDNEEGVLFDGAFDPGLINELFNIIRKKMKVKGRNGEIEGSSGSRIRMLVNKEELPLKAHVASCKRSNSSIILGDKFFFKLFRSPQEGENPDVEITKILTRHSSFENFPPYVGRLDYKGNGMEITSLGLIVDFVPNVDSAWDMVQTSIEEFFDKVLSLKEEMGKPGFQKEEQMKELIGPFFLEMMALLGQRTAQFHQAMAGVKDFKNFEPEAFSLLYQKSLYQSLRTYVRRTLAYVKPRVKNVSEQYQAMLQEVIDNQEKYFSYMQTILEKGKIETWKIRIHGNYRLDKVLFTGKDFLLTDLEGEVEHPLSVRKIKHCPLKDVAYMLGSLNYAIKIGYNTRKEFVPVNDNFLRPLMEYWYEEVSAAFLREYFQGAQKGRLIPGDQQQMEDLLNLFVFERSIGEIRNFIENDPESVIVPLLSLQRVKAGMHLK